MTIFILLISWVAVIGGFNLWDYFVTKDGGKPNYLIYFLARGAVAILHGTVCLMLLEDQYYDYSSLSGWQLFTLWLPYIGLQVTSFWLIYPEIRNVWANKYFLYYDQKEGDSGMVDRFFKWAGKDFHALAKTLALAVCVICIVLIYTRH